MLIVDFTVLAFMSTTDTVPEPLLATYSVARSGEYAMPAGVMPKRILVKVAVAARGRGSAAAPEVAARRRTAPRGIFEAMGVKPGCRPRRNPERSMRWRRPGPRRGTPP